MMKGEADEREGKESCAEEVTGCRGEGKRRKGLRQEETGGLAEEKKDKREGD